MEEDYRLRKFTKEDLDDFDIIRKRVLLFILVIDSLEYLLTEIYRFGNYIVERITEGSKKEIKLKLKNEMGGVGIYQMLERIQEYEEELTIKERIYIYKIRGLVDYQMARLHLSTHYQNIQVLNKPKYFLEAHKITEEIEPEKYEEPKPIPSRCLKKITKEACEKLIADKVITESLIETKKERLISTPVVSLLKKKYIVTKSNERTISDYFRKYYLQIKNRNGSLIVIDGYKVKH